LKFIKNFAGSQQTSLRRSSSDHSIDAGHSPSSGAGGYLSVSAARAQAAASGRHQSIVDKQETGSMSLPLSIDGTDGRTDGRTPDSYIDA